MALLGKFLSNFVPHGSLYRDEGPISCLAGAQRHKMLTEIPTGGR